MGKKTTLLSCAAETKEYLEKLGESIWKQKRDLEIQLGIPQNKKAQVSYAELNRREIAELIHRYEKRINNGEALKMKEEKIKLAQYC
jgi:hypothetical protein